MTDSRGLKAKWGWATLRTIAFVLVAVAAAFAVSSYNAHSNDTQLRLLREDGLRVCVRVQYLRDQANGTNFLIYDTFKRAVRQQRAVVKSGTLRGAALKQTKASIVRAQKVVDTTVITGPTDCRTAVDDPEHYIAPPPEFIKTNGERVKIARKRAEAIVLKAAKNEPLYRGRPNHTLGG